jgi:hypothetical protein
MNEPTSADRHDSAEVRHEPDVVNLRAILICAGALVAIAVVIHLGAWWLFRYLDARAARARPDQFPLAAEERQRRAPPQTEPGPTPPSWSATRNLPPPPREPQLEGIKRMEGQDVYPQPSAIKAAALEQLSKYEWVNREEGIVQIPLDQAMNLIAENSLLPSRAPASDKEPAEPPRSPPSRANSGRSPERRQP